MNLAKKAVSVGLSAALLATLVATVAAPAAFAGSTAPAYAPTGTLVGAAVPTAAGAAGAAVSGSAVVTFTAATAITAPTSPAVNAVEVTFPAGTTFAAGATTAGNWFIDAATSGTFAAASGVVISGTTLRLEFTVALSAAAHTIEAGVAGLVINPPLNGTFSVNTYASGTAGSVGTGTLTDTGSASMGLVSPTISVSPASIPADGVSTAMVTVSLAAPVAASATGPTLTVTTTGGTFIAAANGSTALFTAAPTFTASSFYGTALATALASGSRTATGTLQAPTAAGTATLKLLVTPVNSVSATQVSSTSVAFITVGAVYVPAGTLVGSTVPAAAGNVVTFTTATVIPAASTGTTNALEISFPAGTVLPSSASAWSVTGLGTITGVVLSSSGTTVRFEFAGAVAARTAVTIATTAAGSITNPPLNGTFSVNTYASGTAGSVGTGTLTDTGSASMGLIQPTLTPNPTSVPADGASISVVTISASSVVAAKTAPTFTITTTAGTFVGSPAAGTFWAATPTNTGLSVFGTATNTASLTAVSATANLQAPTTAGTALLKLYVTPASGGAATLVYTTTVGFTALAAPAALVVGSPNPSTIQSATTSGPSVLTATVYDATNTPMAGQLVTVSTNLGYLGTNGAGSCANSSSTATAASSCAAVTNASGQVSAWLFAGGLSGTATVTFSVGTLKGTATVSIVGPLAKLTATQTVDSTATGAAAPVIVAYLNATDAAGVPYTNIATSNFTISATPAGILTASPSVGAYVAATATTPAGYPVRLQCGPNSGTVTLSASVTNTAVVPNQTITALPFQVSCAGPAASFTISPSATSVQPGGTLTVTVNVRDAANIPAPDGTSVTMFTNGVGNVVATSGGSSATTDGGAASFYFLAPSSAGTAVLTAFVSGVTGPQSVSITVGTPTPPAPPVAYTAASALGVTMSGPFTTATKLPKLGQYITVKFSLGAAAAGKIVTIYEAARTPANTTGTWGAFHGLTTRIADANGNVYFYWKSTSAAWLSFYAGLNGSYSNSSQARWM